MNKIQNIVMCKQECESMSDWYDRYDKALQGIKNQYDVISASDHPERAYIQYKTKKILNNTKNYEKTFKTLL